MENLKDIADRVFATPGRASGVCGQTIEAMSRSTFHQISAWDADALYEAADEITRLRAERNAAAAARNANWELFKNAASERDAALGADIAEFSEIAAALVEEMSKKPNTTWGQVKGAIRALGDIGNRQAHRLLSERLAAMTAERDVAMEGLSLIAVMGYSESQVVAARIGQLAVTQARITQREVRAMKEEKT